MTNSKILVVDDEQIVANDLKRRLSGVGHEVLDLASSGEEAVRLATAGHPDLVLMDIRLEGSMDGIAATERLHETLDIPVVYLTAHADETTVARATATEHYGYIVKPFNQRELIAVIESALARHAVVHRMRQTESALRESEAELKRALRTRDDVLAIVSHDLRTPLTVVKTNAELLLRSSDLGSDTARKHANAIRSAADRMTRMIEDLLDIASIEGRELRLNLLRWPTDALMNDAVEMFRAVAAAKEVRFEVSAAPEPLFATCDRERLLRVLSNLIGNAITFTPRGGSVTVFAEQAGDTILFGVFDTGVGIAEEQRPHIFERYWRSPNGGYRPGAGLGLYIAKGIVEAHGGHIWVESQPGGGARFSFHGAGGGVGGAAEPRCRRRGRR